MSRCRKATVWYYFCETFFGLCGFVKTRSGFMKWVWEVCRSLEASLGPRYFHFYEFVCRMPITPSTRDDIPLSFSSDCVGFSWPFYRSVNKASSFYVRQLCIKRECHHSVWSLTTKTKPEHFSCCCHSKGWGERGKEASPNILSPYSSITFYNHDWATKQRNGKSGEW